MKIDLTIDLVSSEETPIRLDHLILRILQDRVGEGSAPTRSQIKQWIESGAVTLDGKPTAKAGAIVKSGMHIRCTPPPIRSLEIKPEERVLDVVYEDEFLLCINKPANLTVHPGAGRPTGTLLNALVGRLGTLPGAERPWLVHRIDKDTSGILLVAKTEQMHRELSALFQSRTIKKEYCALALSSPRGRSIIDREKRGEIRTQIGRDPKNRIRMTVLKEGGREAITCWDVEERLGYGSLLNLTIETGRTHQIRVHLAYIGAPIIGDPVYGDFGSLPAALKRVHEDFNRQALHAARVTFIHPATKAQCCFEAPIPADMAELINKFRGFQA